MEKEYEIFCLTQNNIQKIAALRKCTEKTQQAKLIRDIKTNSCKIQDLRRSRRFYG